MRSKERRSLLLHALHAGEVDVGVLADRLAVSASTVRRDLQRLSDENAVLRTYGGAVLATHGPEKTLDQRLEAQDLEKQAIASAAVELVKDGETLILDAGTTVLAFARLLRGRRLRVITTNLALLPVLANEPDIELIVVGGSVRALSMGTVGPLAIECMRRMTADRAFMSADGVVAGRGLCEASLDQAFVKSAMIEQSRDVVVLADATKLGRAEQSAWTALPRSWTLVTNAGPTDERVIALAASGAQPIIAQMGSAPKLAAGTTVSLQR
ncbi:DeoR/GlpR family transcriptional regulator of sugar metabolism [Phyllobacterium trifolii]|uniref:DeoR/GlpR family transcriptional regulator of sugar metabolism n=1 Tax=Phyllobacterium trifolii TaxID=300193 RepID=A0A839UE06_9HYPH|nr:DeoR/GlpR family DNA-binding transcription regulator [Phyllobacterium trifolii]MBB3148094.1 DeoR/GlpR family transcriptional regulator of sugar metabolism [Phyllobacterium trifolii]